MEISLGCSDMEEEDSLGVRVKPYIQRYLWGKRGAQSLVGRLSCSEPDPSIPYAELWVGVHDSGACSVVNGEAEPTVLKHFLKSHPSYWKGSTSFLSEGSRSEQASQADGVECLTFIPFLFKILSVGSPLSIQTHPDRSTAQMLHSQQPDTYKDPNHKPEMLIALSPFIALCGFRTASQIHALVADFPEAFRVPLSEFICSEAFKLEDLPVGGLDALSETNIGGIDAGGKSIKKDSCDGDWVRNCLAFLMQLEGEDVEKVVAQIAQRVEEDSLCETCMNNTVGKSCSEGNKSDRQTGVFERYRRIFCNSVKRSSLTNMSEKSVYGSELFELLKFCESCERCKAKVIFSHLRNKVNNNDSGILIGSIMLRVHTLDPGRCIFVLPNQPHAYLIGDAVEVMTNSDNVVRAGLTSKFKDKALLLSILDYSQPGSSNVLQLYPQTLLNPVLNNGAPGQVGTHKFAFGDSCEKKSQIRAENIHASKSRCTDEVADADKKCTAVKMTGKPCTDERFSMNKNTESHFLCYTPPVDEFKVIDIQVGKGEKAPKFRFRSVCTIFILEGDEVQLFLFKDEHPPRDLLGELSDRMSGENANSEICKKKREQILLSKGGSAVIKPNTNLDFEFNKSASRFFLISTNHEPEVFF